MGQAINKLALKGDGKKTAEKQKEDIHRAVMAFMDKRYPDFDDVANKWDENQFIHAVYEAVEAISEEGGAIQFRLPKIDDLRSAFDTVHPNKKVPLNKKEFQAIIEKVINLNSFRVGEGAKDIFLYIFGVPIVALLAKRMIPGPTSFISDDVFIPAVTSGTVYYLAKNNKL